jgi:hypothetical protein
LTAQNGGFRPRRVDASEALQGDKEVVHAAVRSDGRALQYGSPALRADPEIVRAAVSSNGKALQFASLEVRSNSRGPR